MLELEARASGIAGYLLSVNKDETTPDGGVDAMIRNAPVNDFVPFGTPAWQFKRTAIAPKERANELTDAVWAYETLRAGVRMSWSLARCSRTIA